MKIITFIFSLTLLFTGCAIQPVPEDTSQYWWYARYRILPTEEGATNWPVDLLIAHQVFQPVIKQYHQHISLWRFHRRSINDRAGHQFSFIFYTDKKTAKEIYEYLQNLPLTHSLKKNNIIENLLVDPINNNPRTLLSATSDKSWSDNMQKNWPVYIMGVSNLWLRLIDSLVITETDSVSRMLDVYTEANREITELWYAESNHALFHHMHALFGYPPEPSEANRVDQQ